MDRTNGTSSLAKPSQENWWKSWWQGLQSIRSSGSLATVLQTFSIHTYFFSPSVFTCLVSLRPALSFFCFSRSCLNRCLNMGNLLKVLTCTDLEQGPNFFLDFESENMILYIFFSLPAVDCVCFLHSLSVCLSALCLSFQQNF